ncbi:MAG TPA: calcium-binding protein, partial [Beijerinckiaceae bacterium]|nr:calcium-binding protein [Beijerinckiaceae bacterium]
SGNDRIFGDAGNDQMFGNAGNDFLDGGSGADTMRGGTGHDTYVVSNSGDLVIESFGQGIDLVFSSRASFTLGANVENLTIFGLTGFNGTGNSLNNVMIGNGNANLMSGLNGDDRISGNSGNDRLFGGNGNDRLSGGNQHDLLDGGLGSDVLGGGAGRDTLIGSFGNDILLGGADGDLLVGGFGRDIMSGGSGGDVFRFLSVSDSPPSPNPFLTEDIIRDFDRLQGDRIDLRAIDADVTTGANEAFIFDVIANSSPAKGHLSWFLGTSGEVFVQGNVDNDEDIEIQFRVFGSAVPGSQAGDYLL